MSGFYTAFDPRVLQLCARAITVPPKNINPRLKTLWSEHTPLPIGLPTVHTTGCRRHITICWAYKTPLPTKINLALPAGQPTGSLAFVPLWRAVCAQVASIWAIRWEAAAWWDMLHLYNIFSDFGWTNMTVYNANINAHRYCMSHVW